MPDFDFEKSTKDGLNFRNVFIDIMLFSIATFIGFAWKDMFSEIMLTWMPQGQNLIEKISIMVFVTILMTAFAWRLIKKKKVVKNGVVSKK